MTTVVHKGETYTLTQDAYLSDNYEDLKSWRESKPGEHYEVCYIAHGKDVEQNMVLVRWRFNDIRDEEQEADTYDWRNVYEVVQL